MKIMRMQEIENFREYCETHDEDEELDLEDKLECECYQIRNEQIGDDLIETFGPAAYIESLGLLVVEGTYFNNNNGQFDADFSLTLIYKWSSEQDEFTEADAQEYLYFEQDPPMTALHNFLTSMYSSED